MKKIGFIGAYDKTDLILNIAKILTTMEKRILVIDSSINQKAKYVVPAIDPTVSYITSFEDIDVAIGFNDLDEVKKYTGVNEELPYDILLIDCDSIERLEKFELEGADKNYFVTSFDVYSLKKGLELISNISVAIKLTKVLFTQEALKEDDDYLNYLSLGYKVIWEDEIIYFPLENGDYSAIVENQRLQKIKFRRLSIQYKESICYMAQQILELNSDSSVRKAIKFIEKGA
jgi:hypothetical protein